MPARDRTGPMGQGKMTGKGLGQCGKGSGFGKGCKKGFGRGYGRDFCNDNQVSNEERIKILKAQKKNIEEELKDIEE